LYEARPLALRPPLGFLPSLRCHAAVLAMARPFCGEPSFSSFCRWA
jgi:hypothetical protein